MVSLARMAHDSDITYDITAQSQEHGEYIQSARPVFAPLYKEEQDEHCRSYNRPPSACPQSGISTADEHNDRDFSEITVSELLLCQNHKF
ncbi:hypothetical protein ACER0C_014754 [Sarotherodon galilaeus]